MSPDGSATLAVLWWGGTAVVAGYAALFALSGRPASLRPRRVGYVAWAIAVIRLALIPAGHPLANALDTSLTATALAGGLLGFLGARVWLFRAEGDVLREQIRTACRGLFLECVESRPGDFRLTAKAGTRRLRVVSLGKRLQLVFLPPAGGFPKVALLLHWLGKQYPGPVPRITIVLHRSTPCPPPASK